MAETVTYGIAVTADDAYSSPSLGLNGNEGAVLGNTGGFAVWAAWRFQSVLSGVDAGATVTAASLILKENASGPVLGGSGSGTNLGRIYASAEADSAAFSPSGIPSIAKGTAFAAATYGGATTTLDVLALIQEWKGRAGWVPGNDLTLVGDPTAATTNHIREFFDYVASTTNCAQLSITYEAGGPDETPPTITSAADATVYEGDGFAQTLTANETVAWAIVGGADASLFSLSGAVLSLPEQLYLSPADANADNVYVVQVQAEDTAGNLSTVQTKNITVQQAPLVRWIDGASGTNTATLPPHKAGDAIFAAAFRDGSATLPTLPSGQNWSSILAPTGANTCSARAAGKIAASSGEAVGTFTNATTVNVGIWRPRPGYVLSFGAAASASAASTTVSYPALTLQDTGGNSWVIGWAGHRSVNTSLETPPTGMVNRLTTVDATDETALHDTNGGVSSWPLQTRGVSGTSAGWFGLTVELKAASAGGTDVSASGQTQTATASLVAGVASAQRNVSAFGQTLTATASLIGGTASAARTVSATGQTLDATAALTAGAGAVTRSVLADGQTLTASATLEAGAAATTRAVAADGQSITAVSSLTAGTASASQTVSASGVTITASASLVAGGGSTGQSAGATGITLTASATLTAGQASTGSLALGQELQASAALIPGSGSAAGQTTGAGQVLTVFASLTPSAASASRSANADGQTLSAAATLIPGVAGGAASAVGQLLTASASLLPGSASAASNATAPGVQITASVALIPGEAEAVRNALGSGALLSTLAGLTPGQAVVIGDELPPPGRRIALAVPSRLLSAPQRPREASAAPRARLVAAPPLDRSQPLSSPSRSVTLDG